jgi:hypothetical protein
MLSDHTLSREPPKEGGTAAKGAPRPFDDGAFVCLPGPTDQDPPYRDWWVVEPRRGE